MKKILLILVSTFLVFSLKSQRIAEIGMFPAGTFGANPADAQFELAIKFTAAGPNNSSSFNVVLFTPQGTYNSSVAPIIVENQLPNGEMVAIDLSGNGSNLYSFNYKNKDYYQLSFTTSVVDFSSIPVDGNWHHLFTLTMPTPPLFRAGEDWTIADGNSDIVTDFGEGSGSTLNVGGQNILTPTSSMSNLLPVEFSSFTAKKQDDVHSLLSWQTSVEVDNDYFEVQRSANGKDFQKIGKVNGNGTTSEVQDYTFLDRDPLPGMNYYRLKQVDFNGQYDYSSVEVVNFGSEHGEITVFPNPATDFVTITLDKEYDGLKVFNKLGQIVETINANQLDSGAIRLNIADYTPGVYYIETKFGSETGTKQFVKVK